jgi:uncharacterized OB-fold protein
MTSSSATQVSAMPDRFRIEDDGTPVLLGSRCDECGTSFLGSVEFCRRCTSDRVAATTLSRTGRIESYTVVVRASGDWAGPVPYALATVTLPEGVLVASLLADWEEPEPIEVGEPVEVTTAPGPELDGEPSVVYAWRRTEDRS